MNIFNKVTLKSMKKNPVRTLVTIIGILISTAMFTAVTTLASSLYTFVYRTEVYNSGSWHAGFNHGSYEEYEKWLSDERVQSIAAARVSGYALCGSSNEYKPYIYLESVDDEFFKLMPVHITYGRQPENSGEIMLPDHLLSNGGVKYELGDTIALELGKRYSVDENGNPEMEYELTQNNPFTPDEEQLVTEETRQYTVVGFYERPSFENYSAPGYTALTRGDTMDDASIDDEAASYDFYVRLEKKYLPEVWTLDSSVGDNVAVSYNNDLISMEGSILYENVAMVFTMLAAIFVLIIAVASVSMIYSAFSISVGERTKQFGLLSSVGATKKQLRRMVFGEAFMVSLIGIPVGVLCGIAGIGVTLYFVGNKFNYILTSPYSVDLVVNGYSILAAVLISLITVIISAVIPAARATHVSAIDAIRQHNDIRMPRTRWHAGRKYRLTQKLFGMPGLLARRYFSRSRKKYRVTIFSLSMSIVLFIVTSSYCSYLKGYVSVNITEQNYELRYMTSKDTTEELDKLKDVIQASYGVADVSYEAWNNEYNILCNAQEADESYIEYRKKFEQLNKNKTSEGAYSTANDINEVFSDEMYEYVLIIFMDDELYAENLKELGITDERFSDVENAPGILKNAISTIEYHYDSSTGKYTRYNVDYKIVKGDTDKITLKSGDTLTELPLGAVVDDIPYLYDKVNCAALVFPYSSKYNSGELKVNIQNFFIRQSGNEHEKMVDSIKKNLENEGVRINKNSFYDPLDGINQEKNLLVLINVFSYGFITLMALICVANVFNTISTNIALRRRDFAMLRSVGLAYGGIKRMMVFECVLYGVRSILFAAPLSLILSFLIFKVYGRTGVSGFYIPWYAVVIVVVGVFAVVGISMAYSVSKIKEDNLIDELKEEND